METVISVSAYNSRGKVSNGEWDSILAETMIINDGDGIVIKDAYIDTRTRSSDDIYIEEDTTLYISHYYYYVNNYISNADKQFVMARTNLGPNGLHLLTPDYSNFLSREVDVSPKLFQNLTQPDGLPYILMIYYYPYDINTHTYPSKDASGNAIPMRWTPCIGTWSFTLKAGSYAKDFLATYITQQMAKVNPDIIRGGFEFPVGLGPLQTSYPWANGVIKSSPPFIIQPLIRYISGYEYQYIIDFNNGPFNSPSGQNDDLIPGNNASAIPACFESILNFDNRYNAIMSQQTNSNVPIIIFPFIEEDRVMGDFGEGKLIAPAVGATEISLIYNDQNNGIYSFDYLHTPILAAGEEVVMVSTYSTTDQGGEFYDLAMSDRQAGIIINKLEPESFWKDILSFDTTLLNGQYPKYGPDEGMPQLTLSQYQSITTGNYWGVSMLSPPFTKFTIGSYQISYPTTFRDYIYRRVKDGTFNGTYTWESEKTVMVDATGPPLNPSDTGHFLIEITGYNTNYFDENDAYQVKSIISSYYITANSFATAPFPDSFVYEHHGEPLIIGSLKVRILNPKTKKVLPIGPNSTIYLQITQQLTPEKVQQPDF
jgi:hypothetical protein